MAVPFLHVHVLCKVSERTGKSKDAQLSINTENAVDLCWVLTRSLAREEQTAPMSVEHPVLVPLRNHACPSNRLQKILPWKRRFIVSLCLNVLDFFREHFLGFMLCYICQISVFTNAGCLGIFVFSISQHCDEFKRNQMRFKSNIVSVCFMYII